MFLSSSPQPSVKAWARACIALAQVAFQSLGFRGMMGALRSRSYGGTNNISASHVTESSTSTHSVIKSAQESSASPKTLRRKQQRQHTRICWQSALAFAVAAKHSRSKYLSTAVYATDLELFRHSLYARGAVEDSLGSGGAAGNVAGSAGWYECLTMITNISSGMCCVAETQ